MPAFRDEVRLSVRSGKGGAGCVSFRREKYIEKGGPDGGDGGRGGDVIFEVSERLRGLGHLHEGNILSAQNGQPGRGRRQHGKDGDSLVIPVPPWTLVYSEESGHLLHEVQPSQPWVCLKGGRGGLGNFHFKSSRRQAPEFAQQGEEALLLSLRLELSLIADIALVGFPNAGKSSLIRVLSNSQSAVGAYPFTTKTPQLGVCQFSDRQLLIADLPGILEGASQGHGMGLRFLKHIKRVKTLAFILDLSCQERSPLQAFSLLIEELRAYEPSLLEKPRLLIGTKSDLIEDPSLFTLFRENLINEETCLVSVFSQEGLPALPQKLLHLLNRAESNQGGL